MVIVHAAVAYGIERMNREVSHWMRGLNECDDCPQFPFIATRGYDSVVWSRLYSRDMLDLEDYQIDQVVCIIVSHPFNYSISLHGIQSKRSKQSIYKLLLVPFVEFIYTVVEENFFVEQLIPLKLAKGTIQMVEFLWLLV